MIRRLTIAIYLVSLGTAVAADDRIRHALEKLAPETRAHQACALAGLELLRRDPAVKQADLIKSSIFTGAKLSGTVLDASGAAVRASGHWYAMTYTCTLTADLMTALTFKYRIGREVPKQTWEDRGLW